MTPTETTELLLYIGGGWPEREITEPAEAFWHRQLANVPLPDAFAAVDALVAEGQVHYPRPAEVLKRCPQLWPNGKLYSRYSVLRAKIQGEKGPGREGYRCDGKMTPAERQAFAELSLKIGSVA